MPDAASSRILLVEDDAEIVDFIETELRFEGYAVEVARDGLKGLQLARQNHPDLIILDRMLPGMDGLSLCRRLRQSSEVPILMLTALDEVSHRVEGLDAGANDYLVKPFELEELLARVRVQLRLFQPSARTRFSFADLSLDLKSREVLRGSERVSLSPKEFDLLHFFLQHPREVLPRSRILEAVWGWDFGGEDNVLEVYIRYVRKKIETEGSQRLIHTVRGVGYVLRESD
ncbi:MAG: response regulator transcription factor [Candidatus Sericytochromatia bacterium]